jgi:hypothetical protein
MKSIAALTILAGSAVAFAPPSPVSRRVETSLNIASELSSMPGISTETGGKVVCGNEFIYYHPYLTISFINTTKILLSSPPVRSTGSK